MSDDAMNNLPERRGGWVFDKTVNVPTVLTIAAFAFAGFRWGSGVETDIQTLKVENANRKETQVAMIQTQSNLAAEMKQDFRELRQVLFAVKDEISKKK